MSFIRPEASQLFWRWREALVAMLVVIFFVFLMSSSLRFGGWFFPAVYLAGAVAAFGFLVVGYRTGMLRQKGFSFGHVDIDERQITYFLHGEGWSVSINDLIHVKLAKTNTGAINKDVFWQFADSLGSKVVIPITAKGADELLDALSALKGVAYDQIALAMNSENEAVFTIWKKS